MKDDELEEKEKMKFLGGLRGTIDSRAKLEKAVTAAAGGMATVDDRRLLPPLGACLTNRQAGYRWQLN